MTSERPWDLKTWIHYLETMGHLARIHSQVDWNEELGAVTRRTYDVYGDASPALLFENIKDYPPPRPNKLFIGFFRSYSRLAMLLGLDPFRSTRRDIVLELRKRMAVSIDSISVKEGDVQKNILSGDKIDVLRFPVPLWHHRDGGRYVGTMHAVITKDFETDWINCGLYRIMVHDGQTLGIYMRPGRQHIGQQFLKYIEKKRDMPVAIAIGGDPLLSLLASANLSSGVSEYNKIGAILGKPFETVKGKTVDLPVPASAEIVIEGYISHEETKMEGPFGEYPGYYGEVPGESPVIHITAITHRDDPILQGSIEGHPINESHIMSSVMKSATIWDHLEQNGVPGIKNLACIPETSNCHVVISIRPTVPGHADWIASAIWGMSGAVWLFKHVIVVDEDIDPWDAGQVNWSIAWRVKAGEDIKIWKNHRGSPIDPRQEPEQKGYWDRVLIDATKPFHWKPREIWGSDGVGKGLPQKFPPTTRPSNRIVELVNQHWESYGIQPVERFIGSPVGMMKSWWEEEEK
jgi:UbiD family decarboxylase